MALRELYRRYIAGHNTRDLVTYLNSTGIKPAHDCGHIKAEAWSPTTIMAILDNPFATGRFRARGQVHQGVHEPIISEATWEDYQARRGVRAKRSRAESSDYLLTCDTCGAKLYGERPAPKTGARRKVRYICKNSSYYKVHRGGSMQEDKILAELLPWLEQVSDAINKAAATEQPHVEVVDPRPTLRRALMKVDGKRDSLTSKILEGLVPEDVYLRMLADLDAEKAELEARICDAKVAFESQVDSLGPDFMRDWKNGMPLRVKREILSRLVRNIYVYSQRPVHEVRIIGVWEEDPGPQCKP
ncbi:hypothetical protein GCM10027417_24790 [Glutamicibacter endophyticus]